MNPTLPSWNELRLVMPEIWLAIGMCAVLLVPFIKRTSTVLPMIAALAALVLALAATVASVGFAGHSGVQSLNDVIRNMALFGGSLVIDPFSQFFKVLLIVFTILVIGQWIIASRATAVPGDTSDFFCLLLGATLGMALMASANNLLTIFVAMETASYPSYALAGFRKRHRVGSEGSLKYVVFGSAASAIMVYGMSLIYGMTGSLDLPTIVHHAVAASQFTTPTGAIAYTTPPLLAVGLLAMFAGIAFKLSAVPLHFWCPDVFEGAPTEVTTFLSVASKGATVSLLLRVLMEFGSVAPQDSGLFTGIAVAVAIMGGVTATWGNLVAAHQDNIKRLLAYSSIAHAGYMIMAASLIVVLSGPAAGNPNPIAGAILFYLLVYLFMNLGAFTVVAVIEQNTGSEDIRSYAGLFRRSPGLAALFALFLLSLFGMPGLGGFMGKVYLATAMTKLQSPAGFVLIAVLMINTLLSLYFYARPIYYMYFVPDKQSRHSFMPSVGAVLLLTACAVALVWLGMFPNNPSGGPSGMAMDYATIKLPAGDAKPIPRIITTSVPHALPVAPLGPQARSEP